MKATTDPSLFVIFGASGDLTQRKLIPALFRLASRGLLEAPFHILGTARDALDDNGFRRLVAERLGTPPPGFEAWAREHLSYQPLPDDEDGSYRALGERIAALEAERRLPGNRAFYLALPPVAFPVVIAALGQHRLHRGDGWTRLVIEKPFGRDLASALELDALVHDHFDEGQIYRIDHYLGKEPVQNLLAFRFANPLFEHAWNRDRIERVEITVAESLGVEHRAGYYDRAGALRDMVQNHLMQLLATTAMEVPGAFEADPVRFEKIKVIRSLGPLRPGDVVFGQYREGRVDGTPRPGYLDETGVAAGSLTPTYAALRLFVNNWRWQGVPFYLRTGKRLPRKLTEVAVVFRAPPTDIFKPLNDDCTPHGDVLRMRLEPDEGFKLEFDVKMPGESFRLSKQKLSFNYADTFERLPEAYETLILDIFLGDQTLFVRSEMAEASWRLLTPVLERPPATHPYPAGSWGPEAGALMANGAWTHDDED